MSKVRVRFAPSPTGFFHIGSARTALFNWLYARHTQGTFILRIEDTDLARNTEESLRCLMHGMRWLGLNWDEGPEVGGSYGPYFQSERGDIYKEYLDKVLASGHAYEKDGAIWLKVSPEPQVFDDAIRGRIERREDKDFVIARSNGMPVFHFVNVVDDIAMDITHVIRGEDHISNTSKHIEIFRAFDIKPPIYAHIPLILKSNGPGKMSKRDQGALVEEYEKRSFIPEALRNYLCLLGWSPKDDREILPIEEIIELFDLPGINKANARFDEKKLDHINAEYVRMLPIKDLAKRARPVLNEAGIIKENCDEKYLEEVLTIAQPKMRSIENLPDFTGYFFKEDYTINEVAVAKVFKKPNAMQRLEEMREALAQHEDFSEAALEAMLKGLCEKNGVGAGEYIMVTRLAVSGQDVGPAFYGLLRILGKERVLARIARFISLYE
ncbi:MAG: glutamate--tRNA ligase [Verrucomicrobia bacterium]|nr:MAG: glutamate--tRNA ligase [Verrucomicrobiota bacterium]